MKALIPPTDDIDYAMRQALAGFVGRVSLTPTVACDEYALLLRAYFSIPDGIVRLVDVPLNDELRARFFGY